VIALIVRARRLTLNHENEYVAIMCPPEQEIDMILFWLSGYTHTEQKYFERYRCVINSPTMISE
jgi:hypothetical protein